MPDFKIGLALSGGGARGVLHAGVLQVLHNHGIFADVVAGTSAGAIMGSLYANGMSPADIFEFSKGLKVTSGLKWSSGPGFVKHDLLRSKLREAIPHDSFEGLKLPMTVSVTNINSSFNELFSAGPLIEVVAASSSVPVIFEPVKLGEHLYVDGGATNNLPAKSIRHDCDFIIGVNVHPRLPMENDDLRNVKQVAMRSFEMAIFNNIHRQLRYCDVVIEPGKAIRKFNLFSFSRTQELYDLGVETAEKAMPHLLEKLEQARALAAEKSQGQPV